MLRALVAVLSLGNEPLLLRGAALIRDSPGRLKRLEPTQGNQNPLLLTRRAVVVTTAIEVVINRVNGVVDVAQRGRARALPG